MHGLLVGIRDRLLESVCVAGFSGRCEWLREPMSCAVVSGLRAQEDYDEEVYSDEDSCDDLVPALETIQLRLSDRNCYIVTYPAQTLDYETTDQRLFTMVSFRHLHT